jgi:hypothetical protein
MERRDGVQLDRLLLRVCLSLFVASMVIKTYWDYTHNPMLGWDIFEC